VAKFSVEYRTKYPKTVLVSGGGKEDLAVDPMEGIEQLHVVVGEKFERLYEVFRREGFTGVRFEHRQPSQLGSGLSLKLNKPWEMHVRLSRMGKESITIHAEVEVSRDYMQHLFSQRTPVIYEVIKILERNKIECRVWNGRTKKYVSQVRENYKVKLSTPSLPAFAWKPMVFSIGTVGLLYLVKYLLTI